MTFEQRRPRDWRDAYRFPGVTPSRAVRGGEADPCVVVVTLHRRRRKRPAEFVARAAARGTISGCDTSRGMKQERLDGLADNPHYTRRFALYVGKPCRGASITDVAEDLRLDWHAVKAMGMLYMRAQRDVAGPPAAAISVAPCVAAAYSAPSFILKNGFDSVLVIKPITGLSSPVVEQASRSGRARATRRWAVRRGRARVRIGQEIRTQSRFGQARALAMTRVIA